MATAPCVPYPTATNTDAVRSSLVLPGDGPPGRSSPRQTADAQQRHRIRCQPRRRHDSWTLQAEAFYRVVDAAYERRSLIVTSNIHPSGFDTIMPKSIATAAVDRLLHHAHLVATEGPSVRLEEAMAGAGVVALTSQ